MIRRGCKNVKGTSSLTRFHTARGLMTVSNTGISKNNCSLNWVGLTTTPSSGVNRLQMLAKCPLTSTLSILEIEMAASWVLTRHGLSWSEPVLITVLRMWLVRWTSLLENSRELRKPPTDGTSSITLLMTSSVSPSPIEMLHHSTSSMVMTIHQWCMLGISHSLKPLIIELLVCGLKIETIGNLNSNSKLHVWWWVKLKFNRQRPPCGFVSTSVGVSRTPWEVSLSSSKTCFPQSWITMVTTLSDWRPTSSLSSQYMPSSSLSFCRQFT